MTKKEIVKIARQHGIPGASRMRKADLVREIQKAEGNFPCFGTANGFCDQESCIWRKDCLGEP